MREIRLSGSTSGKWKRLTPRHFSTLPLFSPKGGETRKKWAFLRHEAPKGRDTMSRATLGLFKSKLLKSQGFALGFRVPPSSGLKTAQLQRAQARNCRQRSSLVLRACMKQSAGNSCPAHESSRLIRDLILQCQECHRRPVERGKAQGSDQPLHRPLPAEAQTIEPEMQGNRRDEHRRKAE